VLIRFRGRGADEGAVAILVAAFTIVMFGLSAFVVDLSVEKGMRRDAQSAADASALAAANVLYANGSTPDFVSAVAAVQTYAQHNLGVTAAEWSSCSAVAPLSYTPPGVSTCISFDSATTPTNVRVIIPPRKSPSFFGGVFGYQGVYVDALAQVGVSSGTGSQPTCVFCILGEISHTAQNASIHITNGSAWVNGTLSFGPQGGILTTGGTNYIEAASINHPENMSSPTVYGATPVVDPLAYLAVPPSDLGSLSTLVKTDPCTQGPGYYGAVTRGGTSTCTLSPGLYVFTDPFVLGGNASLAGTGVTLFFTCGAAGVITSCAGDPVATQGSLQAGGGGTVSITAPTSGPRKGLAVIYDRSDTSTFSVKGSSAGTSITGTVYAPGARLDVQGTGCGASFQTQIVVNDFSGNGNPACFTASYNSGTNVDQPPSNNGLVL
jgi:hypothetical protein